MERVAVRVVVTREAGRADALRSWLPVDAEVVEVPLTVTHYVEPDVLVRTARDLPHAGAYAVLAVTSARGADAAALVRPVVAFDSVVASVGPATSAALRARGLVVNVEGTGGAAELADVIERGPVLVIAARDGREELTQRLAQRRLAVARLACYETRPREPDATGVAALARADVVLVGAPSAWAVARAYVGESAWVVVPGATTARAVAADHARVLEGWDPSLRERLATVTGGDSRGR
ncbi:MAG: uroporphyrinogen-III synthase [Acidimicrobiales bacterium]